MVSYNSRHWYILLRTSRTRLPTGSTLVIGKTPVPPMERLPVFEEEMPKSLPWVEIPVGGQTLRQGGGVPRMHYPEANDTQPLPQPGHSPPPSACRPSARRRRSRAKTKEGRGRHLTRPPSLPLGWGAAFPNPSLALPQVAAAALPR